VIAGLVAWSLAGLVLTAALVHGVHRWRDARGARIHLRVADRLTVLRMVLIAPAAWLIANGRYFPAALCYLTLILTDVADGILARRRHETTPFGVILDPLADILSTFAVFTALAFGGLVPWWLYGLLVVRYLMLAVGSVVLARIAGPVEFHATIPGKIVGVVQAAGVLWILGSAGAGGETNASNGPLFAFLGLGFLSIVVSQAIIGYRHIRRGRTRARGWHGGSSR
jgi:phosphatidylglycerophosphate synthase